MLVSRIAPMWRSVPPGIYARLQQALASAVGATIFFRADDVGVPSRNFGLLLDLFHRHQVPLTLAVVPAWLTPPRAAALTEMCPDDPAMLAWIQHGWTHRNHEAAGKKQEFGPSRKAAAKERDLDRGRQRLTILLGTRVLPVFTPPWNRCDQQTLHLLAQLGFRAISADQRLPVAGAGGLLNLPVSVDLHTIRDPEPVLAWERFFRALEAGLGAGLCGFMVHHQLINQEGFRFLDFLLSLLKQAPRVRLVHLGDLLGRAIPPTE